MKKDIFEMQENKIVEQNMVKLIEDEDVNVSGASTPGCAVSGAVSATVASATAISALFTVTSACTKSCKKF